MVEFDVQVSRDLVPCIYHEFEICVVTKTKENKEVMLEVPVKDLRLEELQGLRSHHPTERERGEEFRNGRIARARIVPHPQPRS